MRRTKITAFIAFTAVSAFLLALSFTLTFGLMLLVCWFLVAAGRGAARR